METERNSENVYRDYKSEIVQLVKSNLTPKLMKERLLVYHENDIAQALQELDRESRRRLYSILGLDVLARVLEYSEDSSVYLEELNVRKRAYVLSCIEVSAAVEYLEKAEKKERDDIIPLLEDEAKSEIELLASFDKDEIGSKMTTNYISIVSGIGVRGAMSELICQAADNDNVSKIYVVDEEDTFVGVIELTDLIVARSDTPLESIMMTTYP